MTKSSRQFQLSNFNYPIINKLSFIFFLSSLFFHLAQAQQPDLEYQIYSSSDGLSPLWNPPETIVQDRDGYIWLRDYYGISRFDGYEFKTYSNNPNEPSSLKSNDIPELFVDHKKRFWIVTNSGPAGYMSIYNPQLDNFVHYSIIDSAGHSSTLPRIRKTHPFNKGKRWIFSEDHKTYLFDLDNHKFARIWPENKFLSILNKSHTIGPMLTDSQGNYWAAHNKTELIRYNPVSNDLKIYKPEKGNNRSLLSGDISRIYEDTSGVIFIGTRKSGLHRYDPDSDSIIQLPEASGKYRYFDAAFNKGPLYGVDGDILILTRLSDGTFWLGNVNGGLKRYNSDLTKSQLNSSESKNKKNTELDFLTYLFEDNQKNVWLNTIIHGLLKVRAPRSLFTLQGNGLSALEKLKLNNIRGIYEGRDKTLWIGTSEGTLVNYNPQNDNAKVFQSGSFYGTPGKKLTGNDYQAFHEDEDGFIWIASYSGIIKYNPKNDHFENAYFKVNGESREITFDIEAIIGDDNSDHIWIATWYNGLIRYNLKTLQAKFFQSANDSTSLHGIYSLSKTRSGDILVCTDHGLSIYVKSKEQFDTYLAGKEINSVYEDKQGVLWAGSNAGLFKVNINKNTVDHLTTADGLPSNMIAGILGDDTYLWIATARGLVRFNPDDQSIVVFDQEDGVQLDLFEKANVNFKTSNNLMLFGGVDGITVFDPGKISINTYPPNVLITELNIYDNSNNEHFVKRNWDHEKINTIELGHSQNEIEFNFVGIHYKNPKKNKYKYQLESYDKSWKEVGNQRTARYTSLDPGEYTFKVMACNSDGVWNPQPAAIQVIILPPWWQTWWAYSLYLLFGLGLLYSTRSFELRRRLLQAENKRKSEELEEARQLQLSMLPQELPQLPHLDIAVYMQTATEVGGDYYDFHVALDGTLTVVIGDATGHGMKAGTMVTTVKSLFNTLAVNPDILFSFNEFSRCIRKMNFGRISMCLTMLKISDHSLQISTAAMPPSYIYRSKTKNVEEYQFEAMPLGAMKEFQYKIKNTKLSSGDTILLLSDGLPELENNKGKMFGYIKIKNGFASVAEKSPEEIIGFLKDEGSSWVNNEAPDDDVTFVVIKVK